MRVLRAMASLAVVCTIAACTAGTPPPGSSDDPYESTNRSFFESHRVLYRNVIRPVVTTYNDTVPEPARDGIHNFLVNVDLPVTFGNDLLQGRVVGSGETLARFVVNSTAGVAGLVDVAERIGIPEHETDFADTMADYGVGAGPYLYLPVVGPMVPREIAGKVVDTVFDPLTYVTYGGSIFVSAGHAGAKFVDKRSRSVARTDQIDKLSQDPYATTRELYFRHLAAEAGHATDSPDLDEESPDAVLAALGPDQAMGSAASAASADTGSEESSVTPQEPQNTADYCSSVAQSRASDAAAAGYESDIQQVVRDGTYKDCMDWRTAHGGSEDAAPRIVALR